MKNAITTIVFLLAASAALAADPTAQQTAAPAKPATAQEADPVIMSFEGQQVRKSEFEAALATLPAEYQTYASGPGRRSFAEDYLRMKILAMQAAKNGLDKDPVVQAQLKLVRENTLASAQIKRIESGIAITDAELQKEYEATKSSLERAKARHILVAFKGSPAAQEGKKELTEEEAKAKAEQLRARIVGGADFGEVAKAESDDTGSGANGGDLGEFGRGQMVPEFEKAAFETKIGEVSPVFRTQFGYHILQVQSRSTTPLAEVREQIESKLKQEKMQQALEALKTTAKATFNEEYFAVQPPAPPAPSISGDQSGS